MTSHEHTHHPKHATGQDVPQPQTTASYTTPPAAVQQTQAPVSTQPLSVPQQPPVHYQETDILGILSLVFSVIIAPVGLVLGIVGMVQAKKKGIPNTVSLVGVIINSIFSVLFFVYFVINIFIFIILPVLAHS